MSAIIPDDELLRSYLLGRLPEEEAVRLEERMEEDDFRELVDAIEGEMLVEYFQGNLAAADCRDLIDRLDASPAGRDRLALARGVAAVSRQPVRVGRVVPFPRIFSRPSVRAGLAAAALVVLSVGVWHWEHPSPLPPKEIPLQVSDRLRSASPPLPEARPAPRQPIELRIGLRAGEPFVSYDVSIREEGRGKVWGPKRYPARSPLVVEAGELPGGTYEVEVRGVRRDGGTEDVDFPSFRVVRR